MDSVLEAALTVHLKLLKMPGALRVLREVGRQARDGGWSYEEYLRELLDFEGVCTEVCVCPDRR